jgi:CYTH domain-containing protein
VPVLEAEALIALRRGSIVEKERYLVPHAGETWEVDVFEGENEGLSSPSWSCGMSTSTLICRFGSGQR